MIDIKGLDKAELLMALYNRSQPQGLSFLGYDAASLTREQAEKSVASATRQGYNGVPECYFDYLKGRVMKVDLGGEELDPALYDRDVGNGAAAEVVRILREQGAPDDQRIRDAHQASLQASAAETRAALGTQHRTSLVSDVPVIEVGLPDEGGHLADAIDRATGQDGTRGDR